MPDSDTGSVGVASVVVAVRSGANVVGRAVRSGTSCGVAVAVDIGRAARVGVAMGRVVGVAVKLGVGRGVSVGTMVVVTARVGIPNDASCGSVISCDGIWVQAGSRSTVSSMTRVIWKAPHVRTLTLQA